MISSRFTCALIVAILLCCPLYTIGDDDTGQKPAEEDLLQDQATKLPDSNMTSEGNNSTTKAPVVTVEPEDEIPGGSSEDEKDSGLTIFFILIVVAMCILLVHLIIKSRFHYLPESVAEVALGAFIGFILMILKIEHLANWQREEMFNPTMFFLVLLPPIIFESGYSLHKGNFFQNIGSIMVFAIVGTFISTVIVGGGIYLLGLADVVYPLSVVESFAFGALISAVDPVATLAIFAALDVDPVLHMLVFGESILNDAVAIVMSNTVVMLDSPEMRSVTPTAAFFEAVGYFCIMFFASAAIGIIFGLISAILLKHIDLRKTPSLEFGIILIFSYLPYGLAEGIKLSGIMAILFCGIVMSHYTHYNLSPVTQITVQQTFRTAAFIAETCVFAYLGLAIFSFKHEFKAAFVIWSIVLILAGRGLNIFPLVFVVNRFREHKITKKMQFIMWFSGLRGAIAFALSMHLEFSNPETRRVLVTTTLIIVLFTILILGGSTLPLLKLLKAETKPKALSLSKTEEMGAAVDAEHLSELTEEEYEFNFVKPHLKGFIRIDTKYLIPFFTRRFTNEELRDGRIQMKHLTNQWYSDVRGPASDTDEDEKETEI
ncbi:sodium/hydrogen exchanger 8-like [Ptychodera flava]|uniref:sodium/hydrogen exchanger 8-like n=1 Tax=Ptychodera flava TaxID=63121 RepID=UPI00396A96C5